MIFADKHLYSVTRSLRLLSCSHLPPVILIEKNSRWEGPISLLKKDKLTAPVSRSTEVAEKLISYFVDISNKECFVALLFICFDSLRRAVMAVQSQQLLHALKNSSTTLASQKGSFTLNDTAVRSILFYSYISCHQASTAAKANEMI